MSLAENKNLFAKKVICHLTISKEHGAKGVDFVIAGSVSVLSSNPVQISKRATKRTGVGARSSKLLFWLGRDLLNTKNDKSLSDET